MFIAASSTCHFYSFLAYPAPCWRTHWGSHWPTFISCLSSQNWAGSHGDCVGHGSACESVKRTQPLRVLRSRMCISGNQVHGTSIGPRPTKQFVIKDDVAHCQVQWPVLDCFRSTLAVILTMRILVC